MKIAVTSTSRQGAQEITRAAEALSHSVVNVDAGKGKLFDAAEKEQPDLILIDGAECETGMLAEIEAITTAHPGIAVILVCPNNTPEFLLGAMRAGVREVLPATTAVEAAIQRVAVKRKGGQKKGIGKILAFVSCKGGSGSTFLATNLGYQLANDNNVLLIDLNLQFGDALSFVHDGTPASTLASVARDIRRLDASFLAASAVRIAPNYSILAAPDDPSQSGEITPEHIEEILALAVTQYDFILLDIGRNLDPVTIQALDRAYRIFPVLQAGLPALRNARKLLAAFNALGYAPDKAEVILNRHEKSGDIGTEDVRRLLGGIRVHTVANSYKEVSSAINHGNPLVETARSNAVTRHLAALTQLLSPKAEENTSLFGRLFRRPQAA